jgi:hypothetical protein
MNVNIIHQARVKENVLDELARELGVIVADVLNVPGGGLAIVKPKQVSLAFSQASSRDVGSDIRIIVYARRNEPRSSTEKDRAKAILDKVMAVISRSGEDYSVDIRLYLMEIGAAERALS